MINMEKYIDFIIDDMSLDALVDYVRESLHDNYKSMTQTEFAELVEADETYMEEYNND